MDSHDGRPVDMATQAEVSASADLDKESSAISTVTSPDELDLRKLYEGEAMLDKRMRSLRRDAIQEVQSLIDRYQIMACELRFSSPFPADAPKREAPKRRILPKYRGPKNELWSGQGRTPNWLKNLESQGYNRDDFLIVRY